jgi:hypothetical protein
MSAAIARHSASLGSETGQAEQAFVHSRQGFDGPTLGNSLEAYPDLLGIKGLDGDLPRRGRHQLGGGQHAVADELVHGRNTDAEPMGGRIGADRPWSFDGGVEGRDAETSAQLGHTHRRPGQTVRRLAAHAVHGDGEFAIRPLAAEPANDFNRAGAAVLGEAARSSPRDPNLGVAPADPVDQEHGFMRIVVEIDDDLFDQQAHDPLLGAGVGLDGVPDHRQVAGQTQQSLAIDPRPRTAPISGGDDVGGIPGPTSVAA